MSLLLRSALNMFATFSKWLSFVRFSHTIFALPFALAAMTVAARDNRGWPGWRTFALILAAMVCARTCAMAFNRIMDRRFDAENPRTASRHLPAGQISLQSAMTLCTASGVGLIVAAFFLNSLCFWLSPIALAVICFYSLTNGLRITRTSSSGSLLPWRPLAHGWQSRVASISGRRPARRIIRGFGTAH